MSTVRLEGVSRSYRNVRALDDVTVEIASRSLTVLCGPPAAGKSVLLRLLVGLEQPSAGRILIDDRDITDLPAAQRRIGYVPQSFALFPHVSVFDNIAYPLTLQKVGRAEIKRRVDQVADILRIKPLLSKRPAQLSGGEKQRTAIARGMLKNAELFLLDDPLVGLDFKLRESLMEDLKDMRAELGATFLYVTSDSLEALTMAENLIVLDAGRVVDVNAAGDLYRTPRHLRAAELVGFPRCNMLAGRLEPGSLCRTGIVDFHLSAPTNFVGEVAVAARPEHLLHDPGGMPSTIRLMENIGAECVVYFETGGETLVTSVPSPSVAHLDMGSPFPFAINVDGLLVYDRASGALLGRGQGGQNA
ncbi:MAG TPA: ABC transporter ATP-binding protein [Acidisoma sp.]|uniref:ABC transporter ATP-binding protein n=1 Tax=Acidisoma sp. TaxID=1872115 RepID=UPI002B723456|nr:ABC transporter ATP-binding protein [Acidisoma sp.]HTH99578.1 ABC transporter ATP-binding protein [Acidisoma sp.]